MRSLAGHNGNRVVRDHRLHVSNVIDGLLTAHQPQSEHKHRGTPDEDGDVCPPFIVHAPHEAEHDHRHHCAHLDRHALPDLTELDIIEYVGLRYISPSIMIVEVAIIAANRPYPVFMLS